MTKIVRVIASLWVLLVVSSAVAQEISPGTALPVMLDSALDVRQDRAGKTIAGKLMQDVHLADGAILRHGARITGQVISVRPAGPGSPSRLVLKLDEVAGGGHHISVATHLRALASANSVFEARMPTNAIDDYGTSTSDWNTIQIGGAGVYRGNGQVVDGDRIVGKATDYGAVTAKLMAASQRGCPIGSEREQALWLFSPWACGVYGYEDVKIARQGESPVGEIELESERNIHIEGGSGWLLQADQTAN